MQFKYQDCILKKIGTKIASDMGDGLNEQKQWQFKNLLRNLADQRREKAVSSRSFGHWVWASAAVAISMSLAIFVWTISQRTQEFSFGFWSDSDQSTGDKLSSRDDSDSDSIIGQALSFQVGSGIDQITGKLDNLMEAPTVGTMPLRFPSGSMIALENGAKARVMSATERQVRFLLESGHITADIKGNGTRRWSIEAGPYEVVVLGTRFSVSWNRDRELLDVEVERGTVLVLGTDLSDEGAKVTKGKHLQANRRREAYVMPTEGTVPSDGSIENPVPTETPAGKKVRSAVNRHRTKKRSDALSDNGRIDGRPDETERDALDLAHNLDKWLAHIENREYEEVIRGADAPELEILIDSVSKNVLWELMHAARLLGEDATAIDLLLSCRRRFWGGRKAEWAAFYLAKIYHERLGNQREALRWFDTYLNETHSGEFSQEAVGWTMTILDQLERDDEAQRTAEQYLRRYPSGLFKEKARSIAGD